MVAGARSGDGKTAFALALVGALRRAGLRVGVAKAGPDYLDARLLGAAAGRPAFTLDAVLTGADGPARSLALAARGADVVVVEGVMGFLDGAPGTVGLGSSAELARRLGLGVVLVLDASGRAQSLGAEAAGLAVAGGVRPLGVIANRVRSEHHAELVADGLRAVGMALLGTLPVGALEGLGAQHLGLLDPSEQTGFGAWLERVSTLLAERVDLARLVSRLPTLAVADPELRAGRARAAVAVSVGASARFRYEENLVRLEAAGADLAPFDPLRGAPDPRAQLVWLHGGYPEHYAAELAANARLRAGLRAHVQRGGFVVAECGGYALLARELLGHPMAGLVGVRMRLADRPVLGYRHLSLGRGPLGARQLGAHEFHYLRADDDPGEVAAVDLRGRAVPGGVLTRRVLASFFHLHLGADPRAAPAIVARIGDRQPA